MQFLRPSVYSQNLLSCSNENENDDGCGDDDWVFEEMSLIFISLHKIEIEMNLRWDLTSSSLSIRLQFGFKI